jgi:hypothetical protein
MSEPLRSEHDLEVLACDQTTRTIDVLPGNVAARP